MFVFVLSRFDFGIIICLELPNGQTYGEAAQAAGRRSGNAVSQLLSRFNREGLAAIEPRHGGGPRPVYGVAEQERILAEARRTPDRTWCETGKIKRKRKAGVVEVVDPDATAKKT